VKIVSSRDECQCENYIRLQKKIVKPCGEDAKVTSLVISEHFSAFIRHENFKPLVLKKYLNEALSYDERKE
jgi:hypothetical protein